jgi:hypothetical protein
VLTATVTFHNLFLGRMHGPYSKISVYREDSPSSKAMKIIYIFLDLFLNLNSSMPKSLCKSLTCLVELSLYMMKKEAFLLEVDAKNLMLVNCFLQKIHRTKKRFLSLV